MAGWNDAVARPVTVGIVLGTLAVVAVAAPVIDAPALAGRAAPAMRRELRPRLGSWMVLPPPMLGPVLLGREWTIGAAALEAAEAAGRSF